MYIVYTDMWLYMKYVMKIYVYNGDVGIKYRIKLIYVIKQFFGCSSSILLAKELTLQYVLND